MADLRSLFDGLDTRDIQAAVLLFQTLEVPAGETLIAEFDTTDSMYLLEEGSVNIESNGAIVATLGPGAVIGEIGLFTQAIRTASVITKEASVVRCLTRNRFDALLEAKNPVAAAIERRALRQLTHRLRQQVSTLQAAAVALPELQVHGSHEPAQGITAPLSARALTGLLGASSAFIGQKTRRLRRMAVDAHLRVFAEDEILTELDEMPGLHVLLAGRVEAWTGLPQGGRRSGVRVAAIEDGRVFGICSTVDGGVPPLKFVAQDESSVLSLDAEVTLALYETDSPAGSVLRQALIASLFAQIQDATKTLKDALQAVEKVGDDAMVPMPVVRDQPTDETWDAWY